MRTSQFLVPRCVLHLSILEMSSSRAEISVAATIVAGCGSSPRVRLALEERERPLQRPARKMSVNECAIALLIKDGAGG